MQLYEYKVVPAPKKGQRGNGVRGTEGKFAHALQLLMNEYGAKGWEYQRTDTLPCEERAGLTGRNTTYQNLLVFRRLLPQEKPADRPKLLTQDQAAPTPRPKAASESSQPERIAPITEGKAPALGAPAKDDPGKTVSAPGVVAE